MNNTQRTSVPTNMRYLHILEQARSNSLWSFPFGRNRRATADSSSLWLAPSPGFSTRSGRRALRAYAQPRLRSGNQLGCLSNCRAGAVPPDNMAKRGQAPRTPPAQALSPTQRPTTSPPRRPSTPWSKPSGTPSGSLSSLKAAARRKAAQQLVTPTTTVHDPVPSPHLHDQPPVRRSLQSTCCVPVHLPFGAAAGASRSSWRPASGSWAWRRWTSGCSPPRSCPPTPPTACPHS